MTNMFRIYLERERVQFKRIDEEKESSQYAIPYVYDGKKKGKVRVSLVRGT